MSKIDTYTRIEVALADDDMPSAIALFDEIADESEAGYYAAQREALNLGLPPFFSAFMPKSGGTYLYNRLLAAGAIDVQNYVWRPFDPLSCYLVPSRLTLFMRGGTTMHSHLQPNAWNLRQMRLAGVRRVWVHVRDPRAAAWSAVRHGMGEGQGSGDIATERLSLESKIRDAWLRLRPGESFPFDLSIDEQIRHFFSRFLGWIRGWYDLRHSSDFAILFTTHETLALDRTTLQNSVKEFFSAPSTIDGFLDDIRAEDRFRTGSITEWREKVSADVATWMTDQVPEELRQFFAWTA